MSNYGNHQYPDRTTRTDHRHDHSQNAGRPHRRPRMGCADGNPVRGREPWHNRTSRSSRSVGRNIRRRRNVAEFESGWADHQPCDGKVHRDGDRFPYTATVQFHQEIKENWRHLRAVFALDGVDWRSWTAADRTAVAFLLLKRQHKRAGDTGALRELLLMVGDNAGVAVLDRQLMGQTPSIETTL